MNENILIYSFLIKYLWFRSLSVTLNDDFKVPDIW
jgi:hypothetical protein